MIPAVQQIEVAFFVYFSFYKLDVLIFCEICILGVHPFTILRSNLSLNIVTEVKNFL